MDKQQFLLTAALLLILCLLILCLPLSQNSPESTSLCISEICAKNDSVLADNRGRYPDYLELYNPGDSMDLTGYRITDGVGTMTLEGITLESGEYRIFFLEQDAGFALKAVGGAVLQVLAPDGSVAAQATTLPCSADEATVFQDGYYTCGRPTPGFSNDAAGITAFYEGFSGNPLPVVVSEILADNRSALPDSHGHFGDVVELQNISQEAVSLSGWYLSDSQENRHRFRLPAITLSPGEFLLLFSDGGSQTCQEETHINFGLSYGESLYLTDSAGNYQCILPAYDTPDIATVLLADGTYAQAAPSLGYANDENGVSAFIAQRTYGSAPLVISQVLLSSAGVPYDGAIQDVVEIRNTADTTVSTQGWYLTDSADPMQYPLPQETLKPGESLVIPCTKETTGFSLTADETLRLIGPDFLIASSVVCNAGNSGQSIQLLEDTYRYESVTLTTAPETGLVISECMSNNSSYFRAPDKTTCDWIELYNSSSAPILLSDYSLSDSIDATGFRLPEIMLAPGKYICILLSADGTGLPTGYGSLPFSLSYEGDALYLHHNGKITDYVLVPALGNNESYGRIAGSNQLSLLRHPTPGSANSDGASVSAPVTVLTAPGVFENTEVIEVVLSAPGDIYYTTNCTTPTRNSNRYTGPITLTKTTILRVVCYEFGKSASDVTDLTYLLNEGDHLSAISIVTEPGNLWDFATGIYAEGPGYTETFPHEGANYWEDWEYGATITFFDQEGAGFDSTPFGLKIFGGYSRALRKKSFACMFRAKYGASSLDYPVFGEEGLESYESIVLRAGGQEVFSNRVKDEAITSYVNSTLGIPVQKYRPVVLYLNGKYFGIYFIREKINENYVTGNYNTPKEDVQLTYWSGKYNAAYQSLITYMKTNRLTEQVHYDYIASQVDLQNYTDYMITQLWIANDDTANVKFFSTPETPWTWVLYDTDLAMDDPAQDSLAWQLKSSQLHNNDVSCKALLLLLLENADYRDYFLERTAWQVNNIWNSEAFISHLDSVAAEIAADIPKECQRWEGTPASWERHLEKIRSFARERLPYFLDSVQRHFGLTDRQMENYGFVLPDA